MKSLCKFIRDRSTRYVSTEGTEARLKAERDLEQMKSETAYYAELGRDIAVLVQRNHIAEHLRMTITGRI